MAWWSAAPCASTPAAAPGVGETVAMLNEGRRPQTTRPRHRSSVSSRRTTRRVDCPSGRRVSKSRHAGRSPTATPRRSPRSTSTPSSPDARNGCSSTSWPTPTSPRSSQREALAGCRGVARRRHRRHLDAEHQHLESLNDVVERITGIKHAEQFRRVVRAATVEMVEHHARRPPAIGSTGHPTRARQDRRLAAPTTSAAGNLGALRRAGACGRRQGRRRPRGVSRASWDHQALGDAERVVVAVTGAPTPRG